MKKSYFFLIALLLVLDLSHVVLAQTAEEEAENTINVASQLSQNEIDALKSQIESEFGIGSVKKWYLYIDPYDTIKCLDFKKYNDIFINPNIGYVKTLLKYFYNSVEAVSDNIYNVQVSPSIVYTIAIGEGLYSDQITGYIKDYYCAYETSAFGSEEVYGFGSLGLDHFYDDAPNLRAGGFLRSDFNDGDEYILYKNLNELGEEANGAIFSNLEYGIEGLAARVAWSKWLFLRDAASEEIGMIPDINSENLLSKETVDFWTYHYFQRPASKSILKQKYESGQLDNYMKKPGSKIVAGLGGGTCLKYEAILRTATNKHIRELGLLA